MFKAYITNLGKYNEGELVGEWLAFPCDEEEFEDCLERIGIGSVDDFGNPYEEYFVTDYDSDIIPARGLGEYLSYEELNDLGEKSEELESLDKTFGDGFSYDLIQEVGDIDRVLDNIDDMFVFEGDSDSDIGYYYVDARGGAEELSKDTIERYFDYEMLGRDLGFDGYENDEGESISAGEYWCGDADASDYDIGLEAVEAVGIEGINNPEAYFDYDAYGRDIRLELEIYNVKTDDYDRYWVEFLN